MLVKDFMNQTPATISPKENLSDALELMAQRKSRHLVVLDEGSMVVGMLSDRDLAMYYDPEGMTEDRWKEVSVQKIMSGDPISIGSSAPISEAAKLILKSAVSALAVVDNGILVGVLSDRDFTRHFAQGEE